MTLLFAGHDTSASATMRLWSEIARHPHIWDKIIAEQQQVTPSPSQCPHPCTLLPLTVDLRVQGLSFMVTPLG